MKVYHFTDFQNLDSIFRTGALLSEAILPRDTEVVRHVDPRVVQGRRNRAIPIEPGGQLTDYVPFYFAAKSPMLYRVATGVNVTNGITPQDNLAFFVLDLGDSPQGVLDSRQVLVTSGHALSEFAEFRKATRANIEELVDFEVIGAFMWRNTPEDPHRMHRRQAEILVHHQVQLDSSLISLAVNSKLASNLIHDILGNHGLDLQCRVEPDLFYPQR